jgi:hypothetical protein
LLVLGSYYLCSLDFSTYWLENESRIGMFQKRKWLTMKNHYKKFVKTLYMKLELWKAKLRNTQDC